MNQNEFVGENSIFELRNLVINNSIDNVFLVTGKNSYTLSGADRLMKNLLANCSVTRFSNFSENPKIEDVKKGIELFNQVGDVDHVIAIGGGSVIDMAKLIKLLAGHTKDVEGYISGKEKIKPNKLPLLAIPTTSGSGSEATHFAVVYIGDQKFSVADQCVLPKYSIVDPRFTYNSSNYLTATTGIDALSQAIESHWSKGSTIESRKFSSRAIKIILENLENAISTNDKVYREQMSLGSNLSGKAINISKTTGPHALSYGFTTYFGIPHGHAVGLTLGNFFLINDRKVDQKDYSTRERLDEVYALMNCNNALDCCLKLTELMISIGLETKISKLGIQINQFENLISLVNLERMGNHPVDVNKEDILNLLHSIL